MLQVGTGRTNALAVLFGRYQRKLFNFFLKLGHGRTQSEDLVQDTFIRMLRYAGSYQDSGNYLGWMYQIARNVAADAYRALEDEELLEEDAEATLPGDPEQNPASTREQQELEARLQQAMAKLPRESRELVLLSRVRELSSEELAQLFDCSVNAVKVRLHRALLKLREYFDAAGSIDE
jgi:RNA polymerase sigma-70 factor (ECF subfamily)